MKVSFIIPAYNEEAYILDCLHALSHEIGKNGSSLQTEVIVVDNASTDKTASIAESVPGVRVIYEPTKGVSWARQKGLEEATGDIVAYIDADTKVPEGWLPIVLEEFAEDPELVAVSGPYLYYDLPDFWKTMAVPYQSLAEKLAFILTGQCVFGGNFVAKREAMVEVGGFDLSIPFYGEDADIVRRLRQAGKFRFSGKMIVLSSARRFNQEGILKTTGIDALNLISEAIRKRAFLSAYRDVR